jgi:hypothetical protein
MLPAIRIMRMIVIVVVRMMVVMVVTVMGTAHGMLSFLLAATGS